MRERLNSSLSLSLLCTYTTILLFLICHYYITTVLISKTVLRIVLEAYLSVYKIIHRCFKTSSIIRGFSGFVDFLDSREGKERNPRE